MKKRLLSFFLVCVLSLLALTGCDLMESAEKDDGAQTTQTTENFRDTTTKPDGTTEAPSASDVPSGSSFAVHFIDVGQADAALVLCDGKAMLIDGGNAEDSNLIYSYLQKHHVTHLDYVVCTHAHEDHVGGLSGALTYATVGIALSPVTEYDTKAFRNFVSRVEARGKTLTVPQVGDSFSLGSASVTVVGPVKAYDETNDTSIVLRIVYGNLSFLFTGDMEASAEADLLESGANVSATVLKVGHHGSNTSSSYRFLRAVAPTYGVISVGTDNSYGHPHEEVLSRYRDADVKLYRTDLQGDIICKSTDGKTLTFTTARNSDAVTNPTEGDRTESDGNSGSEYAYIGNLNSLVYHLPTCTSLPNEENRIYFITEEEALNAGYHACGRCKP